jgi:hypothetical protein
MAQNTTPIFGLTPHTAGITTGTAANTNKDGTGTVATVFTAGVNGSKIDRVFLQHMGSNTATVVRFFVNNGSSQSVAANNYLIHEEALASWSNSETTASTSTIWPANLILPAGYKLNVTIGTAIASGIMCTGEGSDY